MRDDRVAAAAGEQATGPAAGVRWLDDEEQSAWRAFIEGTTRLTEHLNRVLADHGLSLTEYEIFVRLSEAPGGWLRMSELADAVVNSRSRLTHTVSRLECRGLLARCPDPLDGRGVRCSLTEAGYELLHVVAPAHVTSVREALLDPLCREQFLAVGESMRAVADRLRG